MQQTGAEHHGKKEDFSFPGGKDPPWGGAEWTDVISRETFSGSQ